MSEILKGAHALIPDNGKLYEKLKKTDNCYHPRISSHYKNNKLTDQQYAIRGKFSKEILYGKMEYGGKVYSWFQLEAHPVKGISKDIYDHIFTDFVNYHLVRGLSLSLVMFMMMNFCFS